MEEIVHTCSWSSLVPVLCSSASLSSLILSQLRYLDQVYNTRRMAKEIAAALERIPDKEVLAAVIQAIPEVIGPNEHQVGGNDRNEKCRRSCAWDRRRMQHPFCF